MWQAKFGRRATRRCGKRWNCWADGRSWTPDGVRPTSAWRHFWAACAAITIKECWSSNGSVPMTRTLQSTSFRWGPIKQLVHPQLLFEHSSSREATAGQKGADNRIFQFPASVLFAWFSLLTLFPSCDESSTTFRAQKRIRMTCVSWLCWVFTSRAQFFTSTPRKIPLFYPSVSSSFGPYWRFAT